MSDDVFVDELTDTMTGTWEITTQGSVHVWNLDEGWYIRSPQRLSQHPSMAAFGNDRKIHWVSVRKWPKVGDVFITTLTGDIPWHQSSIIKSIRKVKA